MEGMFALGYGPWHTHANVPNVAPRYREREQCALVVKAKWLNLEIGMIANRVARYGKRNVTPPIPACAIVGLGFLSWGFFS